MKKLAILYLLFLASGSAILGIHPVNTNPTEIPCSYGKITVNGKEITNWYQEEHYCDTCKACDNKIIKIVDKFRSRACHSNHYNEAPDHEDSDIKTCKNCSSKIVHSIKAEGDNVGGFVSRISLKGMDIWDLKNYGEVVKRKQSFLRKAASTAFTTAKRAMFGMGCLTIAAFIINGLQK